MGEVTYTEFPFKTQPYKHQVDCWRLSKDRELYGFFMDRGTGKSKVCLDSAAYQSLQGNIDALAIVAPKGTYLNWVDDEIPTHLPDFCDKNVAYWSAAARSHERRALSDIMDAKSNFRILVANVEAYTDDKCAAAEYLREFVKKHRTYLAIDESTTIKNPKAHRTKVLTKIGKNAKFKRILTGNPIPNGPLDLYSQAGFLDQHLLGFPSYFGFRNRFAVMQDMKFGAKSFKKVVGYRDTELLKRMLRQFSFIVKKEDCLDLPPKTFQYHDVEMSPQQQRAYDQMQRESIAELEQGTATAKAVMVKLTKLHQIVCGCLMTDNGWIRFDPNPRLDALIEVLQSLENDQKAIIWCTYRGDVEALVDRIEKEFGEGSVADYYGDTSQDDRRWAKQEFQNPSSRVRFIVANPATGKFGNTWTGASVVVYYSNDYDLENREQSEDRAHRIGQTKNVLYIDLRCRGTVDDRIIKVLRQKKKLTDEIVGSNWRWLIGAAA